jgi:hypothetical protein
MTVTRSVSELESLVRYTFGGGGLRVSELGTLELACFVGLHFGS